VRIVYEFPFHRILVNVIQVIQEILAVANPMIRESARPDFALAAQDFAKSMRRSTFDELNSVFERDLGGRRDEEMNVLRHDDERMDLKAALTAVSVEGLEEDAHVVFNDEKTTSLPSREGYEVSSGRGDESSRLQERTSAAKAASFG